MVIKQSYTSRQILSWLFSHLAPYKKQVFIALTALLLSSLAWLLLGQGIKHVIDQGFVAENTDTLQQALIVVLGVVLLGSVATYFRFYWMVWLGERVCADIRSDLFSHLVKLTPSFFENTRTGEIISRFTSDTTLLQSIVGTGISMALRSLVMFVGALVLMLFTSPKLTLFVFIAVPLILLPIKVFGNRVRNHSKLSQDKVAKVGGMIDESLHEIHTVQAYNHQHISSQLFSSKVEDVMQQAKKRIHFRALLISVVMLISLSAIFAVAFVGAKMVLNDTISAGELTAFVFYAVLAGGAIATISEVIGELQKAAGASERILQLMEQQPDIKDDGSVVLNATAQTNDPSIILSLDSVTFSYPTAHEEDHKHAKQATKVIDNVSLQVKQGQTVAIVGHSGAGKSTLFQLLQRFYDINSGNIAIFGTAIKEIKIDSVREQFALVPQDAVIFADTVIENIRFSNPRASLEDVQRAAKLAFADEFIQQLPSGYDSELGERGVKLSGGQKQRIAIARAIAAERPILLLDEATSALDAKSERYVKKALESLMQSKTTLIIAHRLSTVVNADLIIVLEQGQVIATGRHKELYDNNEVYKSFVDLQLVNE
ncbi:ABC transporter transmembrane domain-containing protein [Glaciecola petra]|uniref:ABC transporter transmembrane domain-containing protein n=1 Tax=Glaciecola petra TaxID=3075602 RepID=A0ABU2ZMJ4_9ALTE|nr:ABC transporter transmembrane domain-containing protein [Aestuariibacter sp. P117]MDT0593630.1 ABC transporter transmembrane domain-containing protein [Aestuariibacter sp. P117]